MMTLLEQHFVNKKSNENCFQFYRHFSYQRISKTEKILISGAKFQLDWLEVGTQNKYLLSFLYSLITEMSVTTYRHYRLLGLSKEVQYVAVSQLARKLHTKKRVIDPTRI